MKFCPYFLHFSFDTGALYEKFLSDFALPEIGTVEAMLYLWVKQFVSVFSARYRFG